MAAKSKLRSQNRFGGVGARIVGHRSPWDDRGYARSYLDHVNQADKGA